jgi:hypothetical protein
VVERLVENAPVALRGAIEPARAVMLERHVRAIAFGWRRFGGKDGNSCR